MTTVFILINGEDWIWIAQVWIKAKGEGDRTQEMFASVYFVTMMLFGHLTLFALFTGTLLHNFQQFQKNFKQYEKKNEQTCEQRLQKVLKKLFKSFNETE